LSPRQRQVDTFGRRHRQPRHRRRRSLVRLPQATSKRYKSEINRDTGWQALGQAGFEPVRAVAIDEDWSALRFRRVEFIKTLTRATSTA